jgi:hypothetical protein
MVQRYTPLDEALKLLAAIIADRHIRNQNGRVEPVPPESKLSPDNNIDRNIDQPETQDD